MAWYDEELKPFNRLIDLFLAWGKCFRFIP